MTDNRTTELLPCPFCASDNVRIAVTMHESWYYGECESCGGRTDFYDSQAEAIAAWNARAERTCRIVNHGGLAGLVPLFMCEECEELFYGNAYGEAPNYCPNCGAKVVDR